MRHLTGSVALAFLLASAASAEVFFDARVRAVFDCDTMHYSYRITGLRDGFKQFVAVTSYDTGDQQILSLQSGISQNKTEGIPGVAPGGRPGSGVTVFPNPYKVEAAWDQGTLVRDHYLWFAKLPARCRLSVFTLSGDLVFDTDFDGTFRPRRPVRQAVKPEG